MAAVSESKVHVALVDFLKAHQLQDNVSDVDEIVLQYVISILEDLGDSQNAEENIDVDQFIDVMDAYIPGFKDIESVQVCEWMFELASSLSKTDSQEPERSKSPDETPTRLDDCDGMSASGTECSRRHLDSQGDSERSTSESSQDDVVDQLQMILRLESTSESSQDDVDDQLQMILEMFPGTLRLEVEHCYHSADRDLDQTVQLILHRQDTGAAITEDTGTVNKSKDKKKKSFLPSQSKEERQQLIQRYAFIDVDEDKKTYRPPPPKTEPKKLVRYLDGQVVNTKGQKFTEIKREDEEEMKKTYVNLKPARKYRFH